MELREQVTGDLKRLRDVDEDGMRIERWELDLETVRIEVSADQAGGPEDWTADIWLIVPAGTFQLVAGGEDNYIPNAYKTKEDAVLAALGLLGAVTGAMHRYIRHAHERSDYARD